VHRRLIVSLAALAAVVAAPAPASASQTIARNATHVRLAVNRNHVALLTYQSEGRLHHTLAWGAINARTPRRGARQVAFRLDYAGGWGSRRKDLWRGFKNVCGPYQGPELHYLVAACTAPDGSHWVVQKWRRLLPPFGLRPTFAQRAVCDTTFPLPSHKGARAPAPNHAAAHEAARVEAGRRRFKFEAQGATAARLTRPLRF